MTTTYRPCLDCGVRKPKFCRGLCPSCYRLNERKGTLDGYNRTYRASSELLNDWDELRREGYSRKQAAERLGITHNALNKAIERARKAGLTVTQSPACLDCQTTTTGRRTRGLCAPCYARNLHACTLDRFPKILVTKPVRPCVWCGVKTNHESRECKDCQRSKSDVIDDPEMPPGEWVSERGILRYHLWIAA